MKIALFLVPATLFMSNACSEVKPADKKIVKREYTDEQVIDNLQNLLQYQTIKYPDNVTPKNIAVAGIASLASLVMYYGAERVVTMPVIGNILQSLTATFVKPQDLLQGASLMIAIMGGLGLYQNASELRQKFIRSISSIVLAKQVVKPGVVEDGEVWSSVVQSFALLHLLNIAQDVVTPIVEKGVQRAINNCSKKIEFNAVNR